MTTATPTEADVRTRNSILRQLDWDPEVDASAVGVAAKAGVVTLSGYVDSYAGKLAAERAAKRVRGVRGVANDIVVRRAVGRTDVDIAADAVRGLELHATLPQTVQVVVDDGHVMLSGSVDWVHQRRDAEDAVRHVRGVRGVLNDIEVAHGAISGDVQHRITAAIHRDADVDARHVDVTVTGDVATLTGRVSTWSQREAAEDAAANAPGIRTVDNQLTIIGDDAIDGSV